VFVFFSLCRLVTLVVLVGYVVRDILVPARDAVRADGSDDPDGGVFDHSPDVSWLPGAVRPAAPIPAPS
jgi:hypothetical protein